MGSCQACGNVENLPNDGNIKEQMNLISYRDSLLEKIQKIIREGEMNNLLLTFEIFNIFFKDHINDYPEAVFIMKWEICYALKTATKIIDDKEEWEGFIENKANYENALTLFNCDGQKRKNDTDIPSQWGQIRGILDFIVRVQHQENFPAIQYFRQTHQYLKNQIQELND